MASSQSGVQDNARQTIVDRLLDAVKQCQIRFGGKTELATDKDSRISCLCAQWEAALQFGMKSNKKINPLRHVTGQVMLRAEGQSVFWQFVKEHLSATEIRRFNSLQNVNTDAGRAHAWLRSTLNEQSLEKYLHGFLGNKHLLSSYYGQDALLMDEERSSMLPMMAAGLSSILFAINIDNAEFNVSKQSSSSSGLNIPLAPIPVVPDKAWQAPSPMYAAAGAPAKEKKRKKKKPNIAQIENLEFDDEDEEQSNEITNNGNTDSASADISYSNTSLRLSSKDRDTSESSRSITNSASNTPSLDHKENNPRFNALQKIQDGSNVVSERETNIFPGKTNNNKGLGSFESAKNELTHEKQFGGLSQTDINSTQSINANQTSYERKKFEDNPVRTSMLSINLGNSVSPSSQNSEQDTSGEFVVDTIGNEPLVDLNSGVALTPVACPDEARAWAQPESDDSESPGNEGVVDNSFLATPKLFGSSIRDSPASSICTDDEVNEDTNLAIGATEAAIFATQDVHKEMTDFTRTTLVRTMGDGRMSPPSESSNTKEMTSGELKQAIVSMMLRKDEVEECNRSLRQLLDKEMLESSSLRVQVDDLKRDLSFSKETHQATVHALTSENDLLKHQLKKYVAAVQSLRRNEPLDIAVPGARQLNDMPVLSDEPHDHASDEEKADFERKLIQVADMHGELIELNDRLQKMLNIREHQLRRLREEMVNLRGPLPEDGSHDDSMSLDDFGPRLVPVNTRPLINIWIPSAFAQGRSNVHHTYQVYVRIKDDEWNVYRRYSDFYGLYKKMSKQYAAIAQFRFPQKKVIGNRDSKFVEIRRKHLQSYLRKLINYSLRVVPELSENPCKTTLLKWFPFFGQTSKEAAQPTSTPNTPAHYTGL